MASIGDLLDVQESGWIRMNNDNTLISYYQFTHEKSSSSGYNNSCSYVKPYGSNPNAFAKFHFIGTSVRIIGWAQPNRATAVDITIDGNTETFNCRTGSGKNVLLYEKTGLDNTIHEVVIDNFVNDTTSNSAFLMTCIDLNEDGMLVPELSKDYEFPVKTIEKADVEAYSVGCIAGEEQLLIAIEDGSLYLTRGDGTYLQVGVTMEKFNELEQRVLALESK